MKNTIILLIFVLCSPFMSVLFPQDISTIEGIDFTIVTSKNTYLLGELAWYEAEIIIDKSIKLDFYPSLLQMTDFRIKVTDSQNQEIPYAGWYPDLSYSEKDTEYPDTLLSASRLEFGYVEESPYLIRVYSYYYPEGEYYVNAELSVSINKKQYTLKSNTAKFSVQMPTDKELIDYEEYKKVKLIIDKNSTNQDDDIKSEVTNYITEYPSSVYTEKLLIISHYYFIKDKSPEEQIDYCKSLIQKYPNNYSNVYYLSDIFANYKEMKDKPGFESFLSSMNNDIKQNTILQKLFRMCVRKYDRYVKTNKF